MVVQRRLVIPLVAGLLLLSTLSLSVASAGATPTDPGQPVTVNVGEYVVNLGSFNVAQGSFAADFYLWFNWQGNYTDPGTNTPFPANFELMNGNINKVTLVEADQNISGTGQNYLIYRIQAQMTDPVNLQNYPFDRHALTIELEDENHNTSSLVYLPTPGTHLDPAVKLQGWDVRSSQVSAVVIDHFYNTTFGYPGQGGGETYSRFVVTVTIERPVFASIIQTFIPIMLILIVAFVSFFLKTEHFGTRISFNVLTLLTAAAFQITLTSGVPQFGFLTLADRLMISVYCLLVYSLIVTVGLVTLSDERNLHRIQRLNQLSWIAFPLASFVLIVVQLLI